jgi:hypothetical protein
MPSVSPQVIQVRSIVHRASSPSVHPLGGDGVPPREISNPLVIVVAAATVAAAAMVALLATVQSPCPSAVQTAAKSASALVAGRGRHHTTNLSSEAANGTWTLKVQDVYAQDTGYINTWTLIA